MRHGKKFNHLGRKKGHREAMLNNMASSLILHKRIFTTTAKAKALRQFVEPLITKSKDNTTHSRRVVFSYLQDKSAVEELYTIVGPKVADRPGGYTRILKTHNRLGDNAEMCMMELVDFNDMMLEAKAAENKGKSGAKRTRRGKKTATDKVEEKVSKAADVVEDTVDEVKDAVGDVVEVAEDAVEEVEEVVETAEAKVEEVAEPIAEEVAEVVEDVVETTEAVAEEVSDVVDETTEESTEETTDESEEPSSEDETEKK